MSNDNRDLGVTKTIKNVALDRFASALKLKCIAGNSRSNIKVSSVSVNRPGLLLAGFEDYFEAKRIQVLGNAEFYFLLNCTPEERRDAYTRLFSKKVPCVMISCGHQPSEEAIAIARDYDVAVFVSEQATTDLVNDTVNYLNEILAPDCSVHGVLMDISGVGVLITGHSGLGKSETALELIHRGHKLVADDSVIARRIKNQIFGTPSENIKFFMEVRGIGIIDVRSMFGVGSIMNESPVELVIELMKWQEDMECERLGLDEDYMEVLGVKIPKIKIPVMPGRNLAIVCEVAARNFRLKSMGYNALDELLKNYNWDKN